MRLRLSVSALKENSRANDSRKKNTPGHPEKREFVQTSNCRQRNSPPLRRGYKARSKAKKGGAAAAAGEDSANGRNV